MAVTEGLGRLDLPCENKTCRLFGAAREAHSMRAAQTVNLPLEPERGGKADCDAYITEDVDEQRGLLRVSHCVL
jgi:hypothetical protein